MTTELRKIRRYLYHATYGGDKGHPAIPARPAYDSIGETLLITEQRSQFIPDGQDIQASLQPGVVPSVREGCKDGIKGRFIVFPYLVHTAPVIHHNAQPYIPAVPPTPPIPAYLNLQLNQTWIGSGAISRLNYTGNIDYQFQCPLTNQGVIVGLCNPDETREYYAYELVSYGIHIDGNRFRVVESGVVKTAFFVFDAMDVFHVTRIGGVVRYWRNDTIYYTSTELNVAPFMSVKAVFYAGGDVIYNSAVTATAAVAGYGHASTHPGRAYSVNVTGFGYARAHLAEAHGSGQFASIGRAQAQPGRAFGSYSGYAYGAAVARSGMASGNNQPQPHYYFYGQARVTAGQAQGSRGYFQQTIQGKAITAPGKALGLYAGYGFGAAKARSGFAYGSYYPINHYDVWGVIEPTVREFSGYVGPELIRINLQPTLRVFSGSTDDQTWRIPPTRRVFSFGISGNLDSIAIAFKPTRRVSISTLWNIPPTLRVFSSKLDVSQAATGRIAYCCNLKAEGGPEVTMLQGGWADFIRIVRVGNKTIGVKADGLYQIGGETFAGVKIKASFTLQPNHYEWPYLQRCRYFYGGFSAPATVTPVVSGNTIGTFQTWRGQGNQWIAKLPGGVREQYWSFKISNVAGKPLKVTWIEPKFEQIANRVA